MYLIMDSPLIEKKRNQDFIKYWDSYIHGVDNIKFKTPYFIFNNMKSYKIFK